ncbi:MAG: hypothetical protein KBD00_03605 [Candidatus Peribacteraceae bacterium]|nr:hypothetical protein [Candidatus Peribacteraceae bacterium]
MHRTVAWLKLNMPIVVVAAIIDPLLGLMEPVPTSTAWLGVLVAFPIAALILLDFASRGHGARVMGEDGNMHLGPSFAAATRHTFWHAAWPHALNVAYSLGYTCLFFSSGKSHPHVMGVWVSTVLLLTILKDAQLRARLTNWKPLLALSLLATSLIIMASVETAPAALKRDLGIWELVASNVILVALGTVVWLIVRRHKLHSKWAWIVGLGSFAAASWILRDFSLHAGVLHIVDGKVNVQAMYNRALIHTLAYCAWPHALNVFFSLGLQTLIEKTGSFATAIAAWLGMTILVPLLYNLPQFISSWQFPIGMVLMTTAGYLLWKTSK